MRGMTQFRFRSGALFGVWLLTVLIFAAVSHGNHASNHDFPEYTFPYSQSGSGCHRNPINPVGIVFKGKEADAHNTADSVAHHSDWTSDPNSGSQYLKVHGAGSSYNCHHFGQDRATFCHLCDGRFHVRLWRIPGATGGHKKTVGTPHHEDEIGPEFDYCHAVDENGPTGSGFDWGRRVLRHQLQEGGHHTEKGYWGNTRNFAQCDASHPNADGCRTGPATSDRCDGWAGSNGNGARVSINHVH